MHTGKVAELAAGFDCLFFSQADKQNPHPFIPLAQAIWSNTWALQQGAKKMAIYNQAITRLLIYTGFSNNNNKRYRMDIQIRLDNSGAVETVCGGEEMDMELSMGLAVECLELNSNTPYLVNLVDGKLQAKPA